MENSGILCAQYNETKFNDISFNTGRQQQCTWKPKYFCMKSNLTSNLPLDSTKHQKCTTCHQQMHWREAWSKDSLKPIRPSGKCHSPQVFQSHHHERGATSDLLHDPRGLLVKLVLRLIYPKRLIACTFYLHHSTQHPEHYEIWSYHFWVNFPFNICHVTSGVLKKGDDNNNKTKKEWRENWRATEHEANN